MLQFQYSSNTPTFCFSAKTHVITLPSYVKDLPKDQIDIIQQFCILVREIYISKVVQFSTQSIGKKICAITLRNSSIAEATKQLQDKLGEAVFNTAYSSLITKPVTKKASIDKPHSRTSTAIDHIEDPIFF